MSQLSSGFVDDTLVFLKDTKRLIPNMFELNFKPVNIYC